MVAGHRQGLSGRSQGPCGLLGRQQPVHHHARLQHESGTARQRAENLRRPARSEMARQDGVEWFPDLVRPWRLRRHRAHRNGRREGQGLSARTRQAEYRAAPRLRARGARSRDRGRYAIALQIFNHHAVISAKKGAPVDWIKMEPATGNLSVASIHKSAPHPNAAKLLVDFIISREGQEVFRQADYLPSHPEIPALEPTLKPKEGGFRVHFFTPEQTEDNMPKWKEVSDEFFR